MTLKVIQLLQTFMSVMSCKVWYLFATISLSTDRTEGLLKIWLSVIAGLLVLIMDLYTVCDVQSLIHYSSVRLMQQIPRVFNECYLHLVQICQNSRHFMAIIGR